MITNFKIYEVQHDNPDYLNDLKIGDEIIYIGLQSNYLKYGEIYIIDSILKYSEYNGKRSYNNVYKIGDGDIITLRDKKGYIICDKDDGDSKYFFPNKFTTEEFYNIINASKKFNL